MPKLVDYLRQLLENLAIDRALFFGHSMGSQLIFQFFREYPDIVDGLVPICGNYKYPLDRLNNSSKPKELLKPLVHLAELSETRAQNLWSYSAVNDFFLEMAVNFGMNPDLVQQEDLDRYFQHLARMDVEVFLTYLEQISAHNCEPFLPDIDVPTLIIAGEDDPITPVECSREMYQLIPGSRLEIIPDGTHVAPIERPTLVNSLIEDFVTDVYNHRLKSEPA
jgi:pimeloyl-ACP methyl ester carboxylesterase